MGEGTWRITQLRRSRNRMEKRELQIFRKYLERRGLKLTAERRELFDEIFSKHEHVEADELLVRLRAKHKKISRATIYRTLDLLVDSGIVGRVRIGESGYRYERLRAGEHHDHLICNECGRVIEHPVAAARSTRSFSRGDSPPVPQLFHGPTPGLTEANKKRK